MLSFGEEVSYSFIFSTEYKIYELAYKDINCLTFMSITFIALLDFKVTCSSKRDNRYN